MVETGSFPGAFSLALSLRSPRRVGSTRSRFEAVVAASSSLPELELEPELEPLDPDDPPDELELEPESVGFFFALAAAASLLLAVLTTSGRG